MDCWVYGYRLGVFVKFIWRNVRLFWVGNSSENKYPKQYGDLKKKITMCMVSLRLGDLGVGESSSSTTPLDPDPILTLPSSAWRLLLLWFSRWPLLSKHHISIHQHQRQKMQLPVSCVFLLQKSFLEVPLEYFPSCTIYCHLQLGCLSTLRLITDKEIGMLPSD